MKAVTEYPGAGSRRLEVRRIQRVVGLEVGIPRAVGLEGHNHAAVGHMGAARAEHGIHGVEEVARHTDLPAEEGHRKAADSPGAEVLKEGLHIVGVRILRTEVLLTGLAHAKPGNVFGMSLTVRLVRHVVETATWMYASKKGPG